MFVEPTNIISADRISNRVHKIVIFVPVRPEDSSQLHEFFNKVAKGFCSDYNCKFDGSLDVSLNRYNEGSILVFNVKEYKHPEKHRLNLKKYYNLR
jgi:hypothetical protein